MSTLAVPLAQYSGLDIHMVSTPKCKSYPEIPLEIPDCGATIPAVLPDIYKTDQLTYEERWKAYSVDILGDSSPYEVRTAMGIYLENTIESSGWQAIWAGTPDSGGTVEDFDVLVQVLDVQTHNFTAVVEIVVPFVCDNPSISILDLEDMLGRNEHQVPLAELYPVYHDDKEFQNTAIAIEHYRFFFEYIWRGWDEEDDSSYNFVTRHIEPRLKLYFDILHKRVPAEVSEAYHQKMSVYKDHVRDLETLEDSMNISDSETELEISDVLEITQRRQKLDQLKRDLEVMENPVMRIALAQGKSELPKLGPKGCRPNGEVVTHIVIQKLTVGNIQHLAASTIIEHHTSLGSALRASYEGDTLLVYPGHYQEAFYDLEESLEITGVGNAQDIIIESTDESDIFMDCTAANLIIRNLTILQNNTQVATVCVRHGHTTLDRCVLKSQAIGVCIRPGAEATITSCDIQECKTVGVELGKDTVVKMDGCHIHNCGWASAGMMLPGERSGGIRIQAKSRPSGSGKEADITITNCKITDNRGYSIIIAPQDSGTEPACLSGSVSLFDSLTRAEAPPTIPAEKLSGFGVKLDGNCMENNTLDGIGLCYSEDSEWFSASWTEMEDDEEEEGCGSPLVSRQGTDSKDCNIAMEEDEGEFLLKPNGRKSGGFECSTNSELKDCRNRLFQDGESLDEEGIENVGEKDEEKENIENVMNIDAPVSEPNKVVSEEEIKH